MSSELQLDVRHHSQLRHLVNAYERKADMSEGIETKCCIRRYINTLPFLSFTFQNPSICMKLGMVNYVVDPTPHAEFGGRRLTWVVWAHA